MTWKLNWCVHSEVKVQLRGAAAFSGALWQRLMGKYGNVCVLKVCFVSEKQTVNWNYWSTFYWLLIVNQNKQAAFKPGRGETSVNGERSERFGTNLVPKQPGRWSSTKNRINRSRTSATTGFQNAPEFMQSQPSSTHVHKELHLSWSSHLLLMNPSTCGRIHQVFLGS